MQLWSTEKIIEQIGEIWKKIAEIEKNVEAGSLAAVEIKIDIAIIKTQITAMAKSMDGFLSKTWKLIFALVVILAGLVGVKLWI